MAVVVVDLADFADEHEPRAILAVKTINPARNGDALAGRQPPAFPQAASRRGTPSTHTVTGASVAWPSASA